MIRSLIHLLRTAPGPLQKPRILIADIADESLNAVKTLIHKPDARSDSDMAPDMPSATRSKAGDTNKADTNSTTTHLQSKFRMAVTRPDNKRKQTFKILAILWDAHQKNLGPMTAKEVSTHGQNELDLHILHENVRKVIRMKLDEYVIIRSESKGTGIFYRYTLSAAGIQFFKKVYLS